MYKTCSLLLYMTFLVHTCIGYVYSILGIHVANLGFATLVIFCECSEQKEKPAEVRCLDDDDDDANFVTGDGALADGIAEVRL